MHKLIDVDPDKCTAICSICGPTKTKSVSGPNARGHGHRCITPVREARRKYNREYRRKHGNRWANSRRSKTELQAAAEAQGGLCAICHRERELVGDHDHKTGVARGMLCRGCNLLLGLAHDDPDVLFAAVEYLAQYSE